MALRLSASWRGNSLQLQPWRTDPVSLLVSLFEPRVVFGLALIFAYLRLIDIVSILSISVGSGKSEMPIIYLAEITRILAGQPVRVAAMACAHLPRVRYTGMCVVMAEIESCVYDSKNRPEFGDLEIDSFPHICSSGKHCTVEHELQPE
ncbi:hypothetical protein Tco_0073991 [Tanacetum coccineum]